MTMVDFGIDVSTFPGLDPNFTLITGQRAVGEAVARRLIQPRGSLFYDLDYGFDLRAYLNAGLTPAELFGIGVEVEREAMKEPRVLRAYSLVQLNAVTRLLIVKLDLTTAEGPFALTLEITAVGIHTLVFA